MRSRARTWATTVAEDAGRVDAGCIAVIVGSVLVLAHGWFNSGYPKGGDTLAGFALSQALSDSLFGLHNSADWSHYWYLGSPGFTVFSPVLSVVEAALVGLFGPICGVKVMYLAFLVLSGVFMYFFVRNLTGNRPAGLIAALTYMCSPETIAEFVLEGHGHAMLAFMLTPLAFWSFERALKKPSLLNSALSGFMLSFLILSYPQAFPILIGPFFVAYVLFRIVLSARDGQALKCTLRVTGITLLVALCLSAFWWLPLIFEKGMIYSVTYAKQDSAGWSATFWQAITLRPDYLSSTVAPNPSNPLYVSLWQMTPVVLASVGILLNYRNRRVWFFAIAAVISLILAMGLRSPMGLYSFCFDHVPFFSSIRTPCRFLMFTTLCYAVLGGYAITALTMGSRKLVKHGILLLAVSLLVIGNIWTESAQAFQTYHLQPDQESALTYLKEAEPGGYRIDSLPFRAYVEAPGAGSITNPTYWVYTHRKETVFGAIPTMSAKHTADVIYALESEIENGEVDISGWLDVFAVKYVVLSKRDPLYQNIILGSSFKTVFASDTIDIYENQNVMPRVFAVSYDNKRQIDLWDEDNLNVVAVNGDTTTALSIDTENARSHDRVLKTSYSFAEPGPDQTDLAVNIETINFSADDAIHLEFYSEEALPDISLNLNLVEQDGSSYGMEVYRADGISAGWNEVNLPICLLTLRDSTDENNQLNLDQIQTLEFGPTEHFNHAVNHEFSLYLDSLSVVTQKTNLNIEYTQLRPGEYDVHINLDSPSYLVLSESYHPYWVANIDGKNTRSQVIYECLNSFYLEPGEYNVTLEFTTSPSRIAANVISGMTVVILLLLGVFLLFRRRRHQRQAKQDLTLPASSKEPLG